MPTPLDIEALRRAGLLPAWDEDWPGQPGSPAPPASMQNVTPVMAPRTNPATTRPFPWTVEVPPKPPMTTPGRVTGPFATLTETMTGGVPGGIIRGPGAIPNEPTTLDRPAPETAVFTREDPANLTRWLAKKGEEKAAQEAASQRRVELAGRAEDAAKQQQEMKKAQIQQALQGVLQTQGPLAYLTAVKNLQPPTPTGSAEGQAFGQILRTQGLPAALQWLKTEADEGRRRGPLTPEEVYARVSAETAARFGPGGRAGSAEDVSRGRAMGAASADVPLTPAEAQKYGVPYGTTRQEMRGQSLTSPTQRENIQQTQVAQYIVDQMGTLADQLNTTEDPYQARAAGVLHRVNAMTGANPVAAQYQDQREMALSIISRIVMMEKGVLTERDIGRIKEGLPSFGDSREIKDRKMMLIRGLLSTSREARIQSLSAMGIQMVPGTTGAGAGAGQPTGSLSGQRTSKPDGQYEMDGQVYTVRGGVIQ